MKLLVLSDFDGTISTVDSTDLLLEKHAAPEWRRIETLWEKEIIGTQECMKRQVELLDLSLSELDKFSDNIPIEKDFPQFFYHCQSKGIPLTVVSDGLDYLIKRVLSNYITASQTEIIANQLKVTTPNKFTLNFPFAKYSCTSGCQKCHVCMNLKLINNADFCVYVGDGRSDFCVAENEADLVIAKGKLLKHCQEKGINHIPFTSFSEIPKILDALTKENSTNHIKEHKVYENIANC